MSHSLLDQSNRPLFIVGQEKNAGKTVTLNRLRNEAQRMSETGYGLCTVGWDGEVSDHLTGGDKPRVAIFEDDLVLTAGDMLRSASARFEVIWADSTRGRMGRLVIGRCLRAGQVELVGPPTIRALAHAIDIMQEAGARRVLIDGAADRRTPIGAVAHAHVGLALVCMPRESQAHFFERAQDTLRLYALPKTEITRPAELSGECIALQIGCEWRIASPEQAAHTGAELAPTAAWIGGPLTVHILESLSDLELGELVVDDPSRLFVAPLTIQRLADSGTRVTLWRRPTVDFISVRCDGGRLRSLPPLSTISGLRKRLAPLPCFDPWASTTLTGAAAC
jgi:hypothetical protein